MIGSPDVATFIGLLIAVSVVAVAVRFVNVPYSVALVLTGLALALAPSAPSLQLTPAVILTVFLPVLLFHGAYNLDLADVRANLTPVALLAVPGVLITAALVGAALHYVAGLQWGTALLFGAIVGATDPVAVLAIFGEMGAPRRLSTIVNAESLFNDGTALVLFTTIVGVVTSGAFNGGVTVERFVIVVVGSLALGAAVGVLGGTVMARLDDALIETTITVILAYGGYLLADHLTVSGPLETVMAGLMLGARGRQVMSATTLLQARATWQFLDFLANSLLFLLVGLAVRPLGASAVLGFGPAVWKALAVAIVAVVAARALVVWVVGRLLVYLNRPLPHGWRTVLTWAGLRGAVSLAAALSLPGKLPDRTLLLVLTFGIVLFTLLGQGLTIGRVMTWLHIGGDVSRHELELVVGRLRAAEAARREIQTLEHDNTFDAGLAQRMDKEYAERERALRQELDTLGRDEETLQRERKIEAMRRLLRVQREAVRQSYAHGQISNASLRELVAELNEESAKLEPGLENE